MQATNTSTRPARATRVERAAVFSIHDVVEQAVQIRLEDGLQAAEHEISASGAIYEEAQVRWDQVLGQRVAIYTRKDCSLPDEAMSVRVDQR
jgi:hypothetical protein